MEHAPDGWFYYAVTIAFGGALIGVIWRYTGKIDTTLTEIQKTNQEMKTMLMLHEQKLETHDQDIVHLKQKAFTVNYRK